MAFLPFEPVVDFVRALRQQEQAAEDQDQVAAGDLRPITVNSGSVSLMTQASENRSRIRVTIASSKPIAAPSAAAPWGSFPDRMEMKMMLSTPRTISRKVSVARAIRISGSERQLIHLIFLSISNRSSAKPATS